MHCSVSHFSTCIANIPLLLHILITSWFSCFFFFGLLFCAVCSASWPPLPLLKSLGIPGQRHVKAIRQKVSEVFFSGHWGESKRLQRSVTKTGRCCGSVLDSLLHWHTHTLIHMRAHIHAKTNSHTCCHPHTMACSGNAR